MKDATSGKWEVGNGELKSPEATTTEQARAEANNAGAKVKPWEKMPREVWDLLQAMQDDEDIYIKMTMAVMSYLFTGEPLPQDSFFKGANKVVYMSMCQSIDRYKAVSEIRAKAGKKGGRYKRKAKKNLLEENEAKEDLLKNEEAKDEKASRVKSEEGRMKSEEYTDSKLSFNNNNNNNNACEEKKEIEYTQEQMDNCRSIANYWNRLIDDNKERVKLRKVARLNPSRCEKLLAIRSLYTDRQIGIAFVNCMASPYCNGQGNNDKKKPVDFDWIIRDDVFLKALENTI